MDNRKRVLQTVIKLIDQDLPDLLVILALRNVHADAKQADDSAIFIRKRAFGGQVDLRAVLTCQQLF